MHFARRRSKRGGTPLDPQDYKDEYSRRLLEEVGHRIRGLEDKTIDPSELLVPGAIEILKELSSRGVRIFIASGTDEIYAAHEAELLGVTQISPRRSTARSATTSPFPSG